MSDMNEPNRPQYAKDYAKCVKCGTSRRISALEGGSCKEVAWCEKQQNGYFSSNLSENRQKDSIDAFLASYNTEGNGQK